MKLMFRFCSLIRRLRLWARQQARARNIRRNRTVNQTGLPAAAPPSACASYLHECLDLDQYPNEYPNELSDERPRF